MSSTSFFALVSRMKYINRWGLMRNSRQENIAEHTLETAYLTHLLCELRNLSGETVVDTERAVMLALYHDLPEIITGDLPTPVKYSSKGLLDAYRESERAAVRTLIGSLPDYLAPRYEGYLEPEPTEDTVELLKIVKAADKLSALIKCIEERRSGNTDFSQAERQTLESLKAMGMSEVELFLRDYLPAYEMTLDEQTRV